MACVTRRRWLGQMAMVGTLAFAFGCAPSPPPQMPQLRVVGEADEYVIGVPDLLLLTVWQHPDLSGELLVRRDGKVSVPLLGDTQAEGHTPQELAERIRQGLSEFVTKPRVDVAVVEMRSQVASVIGGGVLRSGTVPLERNLRVVDAIASMGGLTPFAKKSRIRILRNTPEGQVEYPFDYNAFIRGESPESNIYLKPGDTVIVPE